MSRSTLDALLGRLFDDGTELELAGGMNFIGFTITFDAANNRYDFEFTGSLGGSDDVENDSLIVAGATVTDALETLDLAIDTLNARQVIAGTNLTGGGTLAADRTFNLAAALTALTSVAQSGTPSTTGFIRGINNTTMMACRSSGGADCAIVRFDGSNQCVFGSPTDGGDCFFEASSGRVFNWRVATVSGMTLSATTLALVSKAVTGVTTLNGAAVAAPTQGTNLTDADQTLHIGTASNYLMAAGTTTAARDKTIGHTGAAEGAIVSLAIYAQGHNVVVKDNGGGTLHTVTAGEKKIVDLRYDATAALYKLAGWKFLQ